MNERIARWKRFLPLAAALLVVAVVAIPRIGESRKSDPERIRDLVLALADAAENRQTRRLLDRVAPTYHNRFHKNRDELGRTLQRLFFRYRRVKVDLSAIELDWSETEPDRAEVAFRAVVRLAMDPRSEPADTLVQRLRGTDRYRLRLRKIDGDWAVAESLGRDAPR